MSIAVRVSVWILGVLVVVSAAIALLTLTQKQDLQRQNEGLRGEISSDEGKLADLSTKFKDLQAQAQAQADQLNSKLSQTQQDKDQLQSQYDDLKRKSDDLQAQLTQANSDRDDWKNRVETMRHERDDLMQKLKHQPTKIVYKTKIRKVIVHDALNAEENNSTSVPEITSNQGDQYWAGILRQKAALQIQIEKDKFTLDQAAMQVVELKKQNSDLDLEFKRVNDEKDELVQRIKFGQDLADNLSIDLARSRNDQKAVNDRADRLKEENLELESQIQGLTSTKLDLDKTVERLTDDKDALQKKLVETESVIQSRIDDIWKIKQGLDTKLAENAAPASGASSVELPPIIVNAPSNQSAASSAPTGKPQGSIISINQVNNFVIVDLGQGNSPVSVATILKVYRNSNVIATLEVIQVRKDICAADIKDKSTDLQVGDVVKFN